VTNRSTRRTARRRRGSQLPARKSGTYARAIACRPASCATWNELAPAWDVQVFEDGELLFSRRCVDEKGARYVATAFKGDLLRHGWVEADEGNPF
jgi:hypothetical protein